MSTEQERRELDELAKRGETVVPGGTGGKILEAQEHLAEGRPEPWRADKEGAAGDGGVPGVGSQGRGDEEGADRARRLPGDAKEEVGGERSAEEGIPIDESKYKTMQ